MKTVPLLLTITLGAAASAAALPMPTPAPAPVYRAPAPTYTAPVVHNNPPPVQSYHPQQTRSYNAPTHTSSSSNSGNSNQTRVHHTTSSNSDSSTRTTHSRTGSSTSGSHTASTTGGSTATSTGRHRGTTTSTTTGTKSGSTNSTASRTKPISTIPVRHGTQVVTSTSSSRHPAGPRTSGTVTHTKANISVDIAPYGPRPAIIPVLVSPGYGVAIIDPRVIGFYDGSVAQAEWSNNVEDQWDDSLQTEFADMAVQDAGSPDNPPAPAAAPERSTRRILAVSEPDLSRSDKDEYDTLLAMALKLNTIKDEDKATAAENKFLKRSSRYLDTHPDEVALWVLRARLAIHVNEESIGREAGENLKRLVDGGCDDSQWHGLMIELSAREWLAAA